MSNSNSSQFFLGRLAKAFSFSKKKTPPISPSTSDESFTSSTHDVTYRDDDNADGTSLASVDSTTNFNMQVRFHKLKNGSASQDGNSATDPDQTAPSTSRGPPTSQSRTFQPNYIRQSRMDLDESALTSPWPPKGPHQHNQCHISDLRPADSVSQRPSYGPTPNETSLTSTNLSELPSTSGNFPHSSVSESQSKNSAPTTSATSHYESVTGRSTTLANTSSAHPTSSARKYMSEGTPPRTNVTNSTVQSTMVI
jgi:hypothetical protein